MQTPTLHLMKGIILGQGFQKIWLKDMHVSRTMPIYFVICGCLWFVNQCRG